MAARAAAAAATAAVLTGNGADAAAAAAAGAPVSLLHELHVGRQVVGQCTVVEVTPTLA